MTSRSTDELLTILMHAQYLRPKNPIDVHEAVGACYASIRDAAGNSVTHAITWAELNQVHPDLLAIVNACFALSARESALISGQPEGRIHGFDLQRILQWLQYPISITDEDGVKMLLTHPTYIQDREGLNTVMVRADLLSIQHVEPNNHIVYPGNQVGVYCILLRDQMDAQFPGWQARLNMVEGLGLFTTETLQHVLLPSAPATPMEIPCCNFTGNDTGMDAAQTMPGIY